MALIGFKMRVFIKQFLCVLCMFIVVKCSDASEQRCENADLYIAASIENLADYVNFTLHDRDNLSNYTLFLTYTWDVRVPKGSRFDGFLACFTDVDEVSVQNSKDSVNRENLPSTEDFFNYGDYFDPDIFKADSNVYSDCESYLGKDFHLHHDNGSYVNCPFPCEEHGPGCADSPHSVCTRVASEGCALFPKHYRSYTAPGNFGRVYKFEITPYVGHFVKSDQQNNEKEKISIFCGHHLIENEKLNSSIVYDFCESKQNISVLRTAAGPPAGLNLTSAVPNFLTNTVTVVVQWRAPHDIALGNTVSRYFLRTSQGKAPKLLFNSKTPEEESRDPYYYATIENIRMGTTVRINVMAGVSRHTHSFCTSRLTCTDIGEADTLSIAIPLLDACEEHENFCVPLATCNSSTTFSAESFGRVKCTCQAGYTGNGQNPATVLSGTGCQNFNACNSVALVRETCVSLAHCEDAEPPSVEIGACICPSGYFGDGMVSGSGCEKYSFVIGISGGSFFAVLLAIGIVYAIWKFKLYKQRVLDTRHSTFVPTHSNTYTNPLMANKYLLVQRNGNPEMKPMFGSKWELDRSNVAKENVIGRGNFGVVNKAILAVDGTKKTVAVKALTGAYTELNVEDFLAEIGLLISLGSHENIINLIGVCTTHLGHGSDEPLSPLMVTEYMVYGDLLHFLWDSREASKREADPIYDFTEISLLKIGRQVAHGMHYLSQMRFIHGDVAARNMLVGEDLKIKISDFGLANDVYRYGLIKSATERRVPFKWISPERMLGGGTPITWRSDVWSFGILLYEMVTLGATPYPGMEPVSIFQKLQTGYRIPQPSSCSDYLYKIMNDCWQWKATNRPGFNELEERLDAATRLKDVEVSSSLFTAIEVLDAIDPSTYERDIGRRDPPAFPFIESETLEIDQGTSVPNDNNNALGDNRVLLESNNQPNGPSQNTANDNADTQEPAVNNLWVGDIQVNLDPVQSDNMSGEDCLIHVEETDV